MKIKTSIIILIIFAILSSIAMFYIVKNNISKSENKIAVPEQKEPEKIMTKEEILQKAVDEINASNPLQYDPNDSKAVKSHEEKLQKAVDEMNKANPLPLKK